MATPADLNAAMQRAMADPKVQAAAQAWLAFKQKTGVWNPGHGTMGPQNDFQAAVAPYLPKGTVVTMGRDGAPVITNQGLPSWVVPVAVLAAGLTAGGATGAFAGAGSVAAPAAATAPADTTLAATGGLVPGVSGAGAATGAGAGAGAASWAGAPETTLADTGGLVPGLSGDWAAATAGPDALIDSVNAAAPTGVAAGAKTGLSLGKVLGWAVPAASSAITDFLASRRAGKNAAAVAEAERQRQAVEESKLDPFRGFMAQARDASRLDFQSNQEFTPPTTQLDPRYGAGLNLPAPTSYTGSPALRAMLRAASARVASGDTVAPITPGTQPLPVVKRKPDPNDPNAWLYQ